MGSGLEYPWGGHAALRGLGENMKNGNNLAGDETLYHQYLCGDDTGLDALMKRYGDPLTLYIDGYLHDIHEAEELMIDVFADLFTKKPKIRDGGFKAYLYKAARHMALRRKSRRRFCLSLDELAAAPDARPLSEEVVRTAERNRVLHACMGDMNPDYREALYLTYFEGMSYAQAAEVMGKSVKQITNMVYRGKKSLRSRRHIYIFNTEDLDNDDIIAMIEESPTYTRDKTKLLKIKTKAALEEEVAMEEATDNDGVITF